MGKIAAQQVAGHATTMKFIVQTMCHLVLASVCVPAHSLDQLHFRDSIVGIL